MKHICDPILRVNFFYCNAPDVEGYRKAFKKLNGIETECDVNLGGRFEGLWADQECVERGIIWAPNDELDVIAHEVMHATQWALENRRDIPLNDTTSELYAYYQQYLTKEILSNTVETRIKVRKDLPNEPEKKVRKKKGRPRKKS